MHQRLYVMEIIPHWYLVPLEDGMYWDDNRRKPDMEQMMIAEIEVTQDITEAKLFSGSADEPASAIMASFKEAKLVPLLA